MSLFLIIALGVFTALLFRRRKLSNHSIDNQYERPPLHNAWDWLGIFTLVKLVQHFKQQDVCQYTDRLFKTYGDTYAVNILGKRIIFTHNTHNITRVLSTGVGDYFPADHIGSLFMYATPNGIFAAKGLEEWKKTRKVFRTALANNREICNLSVLEEHVGRFLRSVPLNRTGFNIQATFADLCTDIMTSFALGASADQLGSTQTTSNEHFVKNLNYIKNTIANCGRLGPLHHLYSKKRFQIACDGARKHVIEHVDQELANPGKVSDGNQSKRSVGGSLFLRGLVRDTQDVNQLSDHCLSILLAAIDSMTTVLSATFFLLAKDERVTEKLRATILENVGYEHPTYEQLQSMKYLHYVLNEGM
jgi:hypothetical protein